MRGLPLHAGARRLDDDCAVLEFGSETLILNHDTMAEGTHFRADADMADVAWKLVASNLSDLAAKGAEPIGVLLGHCLGDGDEQFLNGLSEALHTFNTRLLGGDTVKAPGANVVGLTAIGRATHTPVPSRCGAQIGDEVYVTGTLGGAMLGFEGASEHLGAFHRPNARLAEGRALAPVVTAMMDVSDGLLLDAFRLAEASGVSIALEGEAVPVASTERRADALRWGDDYELLFTMPVGKNPPVDAAKIGEVLSKGFAPLTLDGHPLVNAQGLGFEHR
ncbi:MAG: thiamine-phosphate kinase [Erythrobacter sp.]|uniref:thiamine-phosphate kinase n=1 Tax=Erythrobacter sp. TaxID=1042 RepID=UPI0032657D3D